jgi:glycosyltransferase involved in cell wall biosynthesis
MTPPFIDVVIPTWNRAALLRRALDSLLAQNYPSDRYRVIVVDDGSTDETWPALEAVRASDPRVTAVRADHGGSFNARNAGWRAGGGDIVAFTDDDCVADRNWLHAIAEALADDAVTGVQGRTLTVPELKTPLTHQIVVARPNTIYETCNIAYRREILTSVGGFEPDLFYSGDSLLGAAVSARGKIAFAPDMLVVHPPRPRVFLGRKEWAQWLQGAQSLQRKHPEFFRRERARHFLLLVLWKWAVLVPAKNILENMPWLVRSPRLYFKFVGCLLRERMNLLAALPNFISKSR